MYSIFWAVSYGSYLLGISVLPVIAPVPQQSFVGKFSGPDLVWHVWLLTKFLPLLGGGEEGGEQHGQGAWSSRHQQHALQLILRDFIDVEGLQCQEDEVAYLWQLKIDIIIKLWFNGDKTHFIENAIQNDQDQAWVQGNIDTPPT